MNNLTTNEKAKVFAMYLGCDFLINVKADLKEKAKEFRPELLHYVENSKGYSECEKRVFGKEALALYNLDYCTLLLTPLEKINDEECLFISSVVYTGKTPLKERVSMGRHYVEYNFLNKPKNGSISTILDREFGVKEAIIIYQYLFSKGYIIPLFFSPNHPANGKTAIELGLAMDK